MKVWQKTARKGEEVAMPRDKKAKEKWELGAAVQECPNSEPKIPKEY